LKIAVIGGTRGLGKWIAAFLSEKGLNVVVTGRNSVTGESVLNILQTILKLHLHLMWW